MLLKALKALVIFVFSTLVYVVFMALKFLMRTILAILAFPFALLFILVPLVGRDMLELLKIICAFVLLSFMIAGLRFLGTAAKDFLFPGHLPHLLAAKDFLFSGHLPHLLALIAIFYAIVTLKHSTRSLRAHHSDTAHNA